ncbi:hypothetical protein EVAR_49450_1 [Eumeta japonica]|uniref:Uncharacterized protein n=1 Tax=Eumeta variegata TaxID=151549 RepID=A0A4C1Y2W6_EUMVA|nr:hypothetical protein EVAR_49450_1 [Eumeta japonica]
MNCQDVGPDVAPALVVMVVMSPQPILSQQGVRRATPACRSVNASQHPTWCAVGASSYSRGSRYRCESFATERGLLDLLHDFEVYCSSPASPEQPDSAYYPEMEVEIDLSKESTKRPAATCPSEKSDSE